METYKTIILLELFAKRIIARKQLPIAEDFSRLHPSVEAKVNEELIEVTQFKHMVDEDDGQKRQS